MNSGRVARATVAIEIWFSRSNCDEFRSELAGRAGEWLCFVVLLRPRDKRPLHKGWPDAPVSLQQALRHALTGGNIGLLVGAPSANLICFDVDLHFPLVCEVLPELTRVRIVRTDAPERGKVLIRMETLEGVGNRSWRYGESRSVRVEILAHRRHAVIPPSIHPDGSPYSMSWQSGEVPTCFPTLLDGAWELLTADPVGGAARSVVSARV